LILVLTQAQDQHIAPVLSRLKDLGAGYTVWDPGSYPRDSTLTVDPQQSGVVQTDDGRLNLKDVTVIWFRRPSPPARDLRVEEESWALAAVQAQALIDDLWEIQDVPWIPARPHVLRGIGKLQQLKRARSLGLECPDTVVTTDAHVFCEFMRRHDGRVITKLLSHSSLTSESSPWARYTEVVSSRDLVHYRAIEQCPIIVQEYVEKLREVRVTVIGSSVFAVAIESQATNRTRHDWRRYDHHKMRYSQIELPPTIEVLCLELTRNFGLRYSSIDLVQTPDERFVFLELNPNGQYLWLEHAIGVPLSAAMADLLNQYEAGGLGL
jgi:glutathione synthase/RimK-type ligase-like ATP-grasp enzyme